MRKLISISIENEGSFKAYKGDILLDAALSNGFDLPHDCRAGVCGSCRVRVVSGSVDSGETGDCASVLACQTKIRAPLQIAIDDVPPIETVSARVKAIRQLATDVVEVTIEPSRPIDWLAGQYCRFRFAGFPTRCYSPTAPLEGPAERHLMRPHRQIRNGFLSSALGTSIRPGHRLKIIGPYGSAYLRPAQSNRLVLVSSGTGFAPIWSIAHAALTEMPDRRIVVLAGARTRNALYMGRALVRLLAFPQVKVVAITSMKTPSASVIRSGSPVDYMPELSRRDTVHVAGSPVLVKAVEVPSRTAGAACFADAFVASGGEEYGLLTRMRKWIGPSPELVGATL
jgi:3-phenylpropionate/trans-cinnamate dioxygenase ferredoxin reductase subunit